MTVSPPRRYSKGPNLAWDKIMLPDRRPEHGCHDQVSLVIMSSLCHMCHTVITSSTCLCHDQVSPIQLKRAMLAVYLFSYAPLTKVRTAAPYASFTILHTSRTGAG
jgi:hypothetical protein